MDPSRSPITDGSAQFIHFDIVADIEDLAHHGRILNDIYSCLVSFKEFKVPCTFCFALAKKIVFTFHFMFIDLLKAYNL
tara:strand:+ start:77 stop:313 length:237 start_codon:yes stop_codon:yes gene_type:complete